MSTTGKSASMTAGDKLKIDVVDPAFPQSVAKLGLQGGAPELPDLAEGDLLIRVGFLIAGQSASESV